MLIELQKSLLLIIDVQEKLVKLVHDHQQLRNNCRWLLELANTMNVPVIATEQYPQGLGPTIDELRTLLDTKIFLPKTHFSCASDQNCIAKLNETQKDQIIIAGIEAHVCVLQTALELAQLNKQIFVVADAISSRNTDDRAMALQRMRAANITIVTKEMVFFEWLRSSSVPNFKELSKRFLQS